MKVYVLVAVEKETADNDYTSESFIAGVFSTLEKAEEIENTKAKEVFSDCHFYIDDCELDDFSWVKVD